MSSGNGCDGTFILKVVVSTLNDISTLEDQITFHGSGRIWGLLNDSFGWQNFVLEALKQRGQLTPLQDVA